VAAFAIYLTNLFEPIQQLSQLFNIVQSAGAGLSKLYGLLDTPSPVVQRPGAVDLPEGGLVEFDHVTFSYGPLGAAAGAAPASAVPASVAAPASAVPASVAPASAAAAPPVVEDVSLVIHPGERLALVGPTGAGKSTLAKLVARFYDPTAGAIRVSGVDLRDVTLESLRRRIVVVPQEGHLFGGTIADNVRLGRADATDEDVAAALRAVGAYERFAALAEGLDTDVREGGSRLSAGEKQLVSLARAFLSDPRVLVLDEATSSLDPGTEADVEEAVEALMSGRTVVVVAHRLSTAERADRVAVVDAGGIAEIGTHDELLARGERYAGLFASWVGGMGGLAAAG
jgi:ATP-binding cassette subfamily B protein